VLHAERVIALTKIVRSEDAPPPGSALTRGASGLRFGSGGSAFPLTLPLPSRPRSKISANLTNSVKRGKISNMEGEKFKTPESKEKEYGRNVEIHAVFVRHGERAKGGELTERGIEQSKGVGRLLETKDAIKAYTSPIQRAVETAEKVIETAQHGKKLKTRVRTELGIPTFSENFLEQLQKLETQHPDSAAEHYLSFCDKKPDQETASPHEVAEAMARVSVSYFQMVDRLKSGSNVDIINTTHQGLPEALLKEILVRQEGDEKKVGFSTLTEIGGPLKLAEQMEFRIKTDSQGNKTIQLYFRDKIFDIDLDKLNSLAKSYYEKQHNQGN